MKLSDLTAPEVVELAQRQLELSEEYANARIKAGEARRELYIFLLPALREMRANKKNLGKDMALLMIAEQNEHAKEAYFEMLKQEDIYKGLEVMIEAIRNKISLYQSIWKADR